MVDRPLKGLSGPELRDLGRNLDKEARHWDKEDQRFWREGIVSDRSWEDNQEYQSILRNKDDVQKRKLELYDEEAIRRKIRAEKSTPEQQPMQQAKGGSPLVSLACACQRPRRIKVTQWVFERGPVLCGVCNQPFRQT